MNDVYNKVNSYHPEFIQIIEEGLINRLNFIPAEPDNNLNGQNQNDFMDDDDDGFSIMWITKKESNKYLNYIYFYIDS